MLDTNVLVKFAFVLNKIYKNTKIPKNLEKYALILSKFENAKFFNVMSDWNRFELRDVLMKLKLSEIFFLSGYSIDEFRDAKDENIELSKEDIKNVNNIVFNIWKFCERTTKEIDFVKIRKFSRMGYSTMDMILLHQAELNKCDYFVTNDKKIYTSIELKNSFDIKICSVNEFKSKI